MNWKVDTSFAGEETAWYCETRGLVFTIDKLLHKVDYSDYQSRILFSLICEVDGSEELSGLGHDMGLFVTKEAAQIAAAEIVQELEINYS